MQRSTGMIWGIWLGKDGPVRTFAKSKKETIEPKESFEAREGTTIGRDSIVAYNVQTL
ncbi:hypothetical protein KBY31_02860 [Ruegeria pomeroyi]|nr:hypothetical protein [Ruegeria pomeroyi]